MEIGIREFKAHLSEYVARVAAGEVFTVTDRGAPRAFLIPVGGDGELARGLAEGWVTRRSSERPGAARPADPDPGTLARKRSWPRTAATDAVRRLMQYGDSSALAKRYVREPDRDVANRLLDADPDWVTSAITEVEVRRVLALQLSPDRLAGARSSFLRALERSAVVAADATTLGLAAALAEATGVCSPDAVHLASVQRLSSRTMRLVTLRADGRSCPCARDQRCRSLTSADDVDTALSTITSPILRSSEPVEGSGGASS